VVLKEWFMAATRTMWVVMTCVLQAGALHAASVALSSDRTSEHPTVRPSRQGPRVIRVSAERFSFTPSRIEIDAGEDVEFHVKSYDTSHGFRILGPGRTDTILANVAIPKRGKGDIVVPLRIEKPGHYVFECSRMCGAGHNFMRGELVVRERTTASNDR
jgi:cytochrome c oxidase subunit II